MKNDRRYATVKNLISGGYIKTFREIFDTLPKTVAAKDLGINGVRFNNLLVNIGKFVLKDLFHLASLLEVEEIQVLNLVYHQRLADKKSKRKHKR